MLLRILVSPTETFFNDGFTKKLQKFRGPKALISELTDFIFINLLSLILSRLLTGSTREQTPDTLKLNGKHKKAFLTAVNDDAEKWLPSGFNIDAFEKGTLPEVSGETRKALTDIFSIIYYEIRPQFEDHPETLHLLDLLHQMTVIIRMSYMQVIPKEILNVNLEDTAEDTSNLCTFITSFAEALENSLNTTPGLPSTMHRGIDICKHLAHYLAISGPLRNYWAWAVERSISLRKKEKKPLMYKTDAGTKMRKYIALSVYPDRKSLTPGGWTFHQKKVYNDTAAKSQVAATTAAAAAANDAAADPPVATANGIPFTVLNHTMSNYYSLSSKGRRP